MGLVSQSVEMLTWGQPPSAVRRAQLDSLSPPGWGKTQTLTQTRPSKLLCRKRYLPQHDRDPLARSDVLPIRRDNDVAIRERSRCNVA